MLKISDIVFITCPRVFEILCSFTRVYKTFSCGVNLKRQETLEAQKILIFESSYKNMSFVNSQGDMVSEFLKVFSKRWFFVNSQRDYLIY